MPLAHSGEPPHDGGMETRVAKLEEHVGNIRVDVAHVRARVDAIETHMATKADVTTAESRIIRWLVSAAIAMAGLVLAAAKFIH